MNANQIREKFLAYMVSKGHVEIPSAGLVPENDPTTLFTGSGMQPLIPYLMGEAHPKGVRLTDSQKCFRAADIEEVGDNRHTTFFEMLGNWSLGDYFKKEQLPFFYNFLVDEVGLDPQRIYVTTFMGDELAGVPKDEESIALWQEIFAARGLSNGVGVMGSEEAGSERGMKDGERIFAYDSAKNWWSRSGKPANMPVGEIGGGDSEFFYDFGGEHDTRYGAHCHPNCDCGRFIEIGNSVFIEYIKQEDGTFAKLPQKNVDFGGGLERIAAASNNDSDVFLVPELHAIIKAVEEKTGRVYTENYKPFRVIADHLRGATFIIGDGVFPGNAEQGYFVRRLIRRAVRYADMLGLPEGSFAQFARSVIDAYGARYTNLVADAEKIVGAIEAEEAKFRTTLAKGMKEFDRAIADGTLSVDDVFTLFTTYGFPYELTEELASERGFVISRGDFDAKMAEHQALSRAGAEQKFKGGLADSSEVVVQYHTITHLMLAGLRKVLGDHVHQAGSNITGERLRFDFTHGEKMTPEQIAAVEQYVNDAIKAQASVSIEMMAKDAAHAAGVEGSFWEKYPDEVKVYTVKDEQGTIYSRQLCGGPHVENTGTITGTFKIQKEESSSQGIRRIKGVLI